MVYAILQCLGHVIIPLVTSPVSLPDRCNKKGVCHMMSKAVVTLRSDYILLCNKPFQKFNGLKQQFTSVFRGSVNWLSSSGWFSFGVSWVSVGSQVGWKLGLYPEGWFGLDVQVAHTHAGGYCILSAGSSAGAVDRNADIWPLHMICFSRSMMAESWEEVS